VDLRLFVQGVIGALLQRRKWSAAFVGLMDAVLPACVLPRGEDKRYHDVTLALVQEDKNLRLRNGRFRSVGWVPAGRARRAATIRNLREVPVNNHEVRRRATPGTVIVSAKLASRVFGAHTCDFDANRRHIAARRQ